MPTSKRMLGQPALNVRPINPALRRALRDLARARGEEMYRYIARVLADHVAAETEAQGLDLVTDFRCLTGVE